MKETKFKQTEVGMIPSDWEVRTLEDVCQNQGIVRGPFGGALKKEMFITSGYKVYEQKNAIYKDATLGQYFIDSYKYREMARFAVKPGDFIVSCSGTIGKIYEIPQNAPDGIINQALLKLSVNEECISSQYFVTYFGSEDFQNAIIDDTQGGAMKNLVGMDKFRKSLFALPPTIEEQHRIANALSDVDTLIANLEKLVAKKKNIKQGAMQQLLTGRKRLPAFAPAKPTYKQTELGPIPADWDVKSFSDVFEILPNNTLARADLNENKGSFRDVHYGDVLVQFGEWIDCEKVSLPFINCNVRFNKTTLKNGDVVIADTAEDETVGKATEIFNADNQSVVSGLHTIPVRPKFEFAAKWLGYYMNSVCWHDQILPFITGTKVSAISKAAVAQTKLFYPQKKEEQTAIANILSDMDTEIQTLETKLAKYRKLKTGMMQQLLTGKIRLI